MSSSGGPSPAGCSTGRSWPEKSANLGKRSRKTSFRRADRPVPVLGDDQVGQPVRLVLGIAVVVLAVEEGDDVGVLLDRVVDDDVVGDEVVQALDR